VRKAALIAMFVVGIGLCTPLTSPSFAKPSNYDPIPAAKEHVKRGQKLSISGNFDAAANAYKSAIEIDPNYALAYNNLGYIYRQKGKVDLAIEYYQKALELNPDDDTSHTNLASAYDSKGHYDKAIASCYRALEIDPGSITVELALEKIIKKKADAECRTIEEVQTEIAVLYPRKKQEPCYNKYLDLLTEADNQTEQNTSVEEKYESTTQEIEELKTELRPVIPIEDVQEINLQSQKMTESESTALSSESNPSAITGESPSIDIRQYIEEELEVKTQENAEKSQDSTLENNSSSIDKENKVYNMLSDPRVGTLMVLYK
jgi:tetratricopeptide (TPR) repeat protein